MLKNLNLKMKMILYIGMVAFLSFAVTIGVVAVKSGKMAEESATKQVTETANRYGGIVKAEIEVAMDTARTLAHVFEGMKESGIPPDRQMINGMLKQIMLKNPEFFGAWTIWEPDTLDGRDSEFVNTPGHDGSGRFVPIWERYSGQLVFRACGKYDQGVTGTSEQSGTVAAAAEEMSASMISIAAAMEQATTNVSMVATASEEMTATQRSA